MPYVKNPYIKTPYAKIQSPKYKVLKRIAKYLFFNFVLTISPILINIFVSFTNQIPYRDKLLYCPDICFMTIVTGSSSIKDSFMSKTIKKSNFILGGLIIINVTFMILCMIIYGNITKDLLSSNRDVCITIEQFTFSTIFYILSVILGLGIQIGGGIDA